MHWLTLEEGVLSTSGLFSSVLGSSSMIALERSLLTGESGTLLCLRLTGLSSDLLVNRSSKLVFSNGCLVARLFTVKTSVLQEPRTFTSVMTDFDPPPPLSWYYLFIFSGAAMLVSKGCALLREETWSQTEVSSILAENKHRILYISVLAVRRLTWRPLVYQVQNLSPEMCFHSLCGAK